jgi:hypothetical protein
MRRTAVVADVLVASALGLLALRRRRGGSGTRMQTERAPLAA